MNLLLAYKEVPYMLNIERFFGGMEAINYQQSYKLGDELANLFQTVIDYRDHGISYDGVDPSWKARAEHRISEIRKFCRNKNIFGEMVKLIDKYTNIKITEIEAEYVDDFSLRPPADFAISAAICETATSIAQQERASGYGSLGVEYWNEEEHNILDDIESMADLVDLEHGGLIKNAKTKPSGIPIYVKKIKVCQNTMFLVKDFIDIDDSEQLTAKEIASLILHEVGHVMFTVEHSRDAYLYWGRIRTDLTTLAKKGKFKEAAKALGALDKVVKKVTNLPDDKNDKEGMQRKIVKKAIMTSKAINAVTNAINKFNPNDEVGGIGVMGRTVANILSVVICTVASTIGAVIGAFWAYFNSIEWNYTTNGFKNLADLLNEKVSDRMINSNMSFFIERSADEFAVRCGYGAHLAKALAKIYMYEDMYSTGEIACNRTMHGVWWYSAMISTYQNWCKFCFYFVEDGESLYESLYNRIRRILQNTKGIFRNENLDPAIAIEWIQKCDEIKAEMDKNKSFGDTDFAKALANTFRNITIINPNNLYNLIIDGKLSRDCAILEDRLDDFNNTSLYMLAYKFKTQTY